MRYTQYTVFRRLQREINQYGTTLASLATLLLFPIYISAVDNDVNPSLVAQMRSTNTWLDVAALLPDDIDWLYDHNKGSKIHLRTW